MKKTKIEWCDSTWNPVTGCRHSCEYCYARAMTKRFPATYPNGFEPTFYDDRMDQFYGITENEIILLKKRKLDRLAKRLGVNDHD